MDFLAFSKFYVWLLCRGLFELSVQFFEEKVNGEEVQGGWSGEYISSVVLQVFFQVVGEGLWG